MSITTVTTGTRPLGTVLAVLEGVQTDKRALPRPARIYDLIYQHVNKTTNQAAEPHIRMLAVLTMSICTENVECTATTSSTFSQFVLPKTNSRGRSDSG